MIPPEQDFELAFSTEPVVGWRVWRVLRGIDCGVSRFDLPSELLEAEQRGDPSPVEKLFRYRLRSLTEPDFWPGGTRMEAACSAGSLEHGAAPARACLCGIWAFRTNRNATEVAIAFAESRGEVALGRVALWGRLVEQEHGWRGQYAYPCDIAVVGGTEGMLDDLRAWYGVPVQRVSHASLGQAA